MRFPVPRYSLRTLFAVTALCAVCAFIAREALIVAQRKAFMADLPTHRVIVLGCGSNLDQPSGVPVSWLRRQFGDQPATIFLVPNCEAEREFVNRFEILFPEAEFIHYSPSSSADTTARLPAGGGSAGPAIPDSMY